MYNKYKSNIVPNRTCEERKRKNDHRERHSRAIQIICSGNNQVKEENAIRNPMSGKMCYLWVLLEIVSCVW